MGKQVFISHSSNDKQYAKSLAKDIQQLGYTVWFDTVEIDPSEDWVQEIEEGIDNCSAVVVIWTENAATSRWVQREIARAEQKSKPIIPLIFDDREMSIILQRTQHIDFRNGYINPFQELVSYLLRLLDESANIGKDNLLAWQPEKQPFFRSRFLEENNYLNRQSVDFATNAQTMKLIERSSKGEAQVFVTIVSIPIPDTINVDVDDLDQKAGLNQRPNVIRLDNAQETWAWFSLADFDIRHTNQNELIFRKQTESGANHAIFAHCRFHEDGVIEYANPAHAYSISTEHFKGYAFDLIGILGATWKFLTLAQITYSRLDYEGKFQMLINLRRTHSNTLAGFASDKNGRERWTSLLNSDAFYRVQFQEKGQGISTDPHLQFIYTINLKSIINSPQISQDIITHLSKKLQRGFNFEPDDRHLIYETKEFPWKQFVSKYPI